MTALADPVSTIRDYVKRGYAVELVIDSRQHVYSIRMSSLQEVKSFIVADDISIEELRKAIKGI
jgi:hypothetical protein